MGINPDGAVCDAQGNVWIAQWGGWRVACHGPDGRFRTAVSTGAEQTTSPAFGGQNLDRMFVASATQDIAEAGTGHHVGAGRTWVADMPVRGIPERRVVL